MVDGTEDEIRRAETILNRRGIQDWDIFDASDVTPGGTGGFGRDREVLNPDLTPGVDPTRRVSNAGDRSPNFTTVDRRDETL